MLRNWYVLFKKIHTDIWIYKLYIYIINMTVIMNIYIISKGWCTNINHLLIRRKYPQFFRQLSIFSIPAGRLQLLLNSKTSFISPNKLWNNRINKKLTCSQIFLKLLHFIKKISLSIKIYKWGFFFFFCDQVNFGASGNIGNNFWIIMYQC